MQSLLGLKESSIERNKFKEKLQDMHEEALVFLVAKSPKKLLSWVGMVMKAGDTERQNIPLESFP